MHKDKYNIIIVLLGIVINIFFSAFRFPLVIPCWLSTPLATARITGQSWRLFLPEAPQTKKHLTHSNIIHTLKLQQNKFVHALTIEVHIYLLTATTSNTATQTATNRRSGYLLPWRLKIVELVLESQPALPGARRIE
jgi:hypothetical protein